MKQTLIFALVFFFILNGYSQKEEFEKPNYKKIEKAVKNKKSDFYYAKLLERFNNFDRSMTIEEKRLLYYGYTFQPTYSPYGSSAYSDTLRKLIRKDVHNEIELNGIISLSDSVLKDNPFDLRARNYQLYALEEIGNDEKYDMRLTQMKIIIDALLSSGDGLTKKTAFYVIFISHEYDLLSILGYDFGGEQRLIDHYDYLKVAKNPNKVKGFYFDVSPCLNSLNKMFK